MHFSPFHFGVITTWTSSLWDSPFRSTSICPCNFKRISLSVVQMITWFVFVMAFIYLLPVPINLDWLYSRYFFSQSSSLWLNCTDWHLSFQQVISRIHIWCAEGSARVGVPARASVFLADVATYYLLSIPSANWKIFTHSKACARASNSGGENDKIILA